MEDKNSESSEEAANLKRERESFTRTNLRSEFSTPIDSIIGYAQILIEEVQE